MEQTSRMDALVIEYETLKESLQCPVCLDTFKTPAKTLPCLHTFCLPCLEIVSQTSPSSSSSSSSSSFSPDGDSTSSSSSAYDPPLFDSPSSLLINLSSSVDEELFEILPSPPPKRKAKNKKDSVTNNEDTTPSTAPIKTGTKRGRRNPDKNAPLPPPKVSRSHYLPPDELHHPCPMCRRLFSLSQAVDNPVIHSLLDRLNSLANLLEIDSSAPVPLLVNPSSSSSSSSSSSRCAPGLQDKKDRASLLVDCVENRHQDIMTSLSLIDLMETKLQENMISEKERIELHFVKIEESIKAQLSRRKEGLMRQLETRSNQKLVRLAQQRKTLEADLSCLENSVKVSRSFIKNATDHQISSHLPFITDQLTRLKEDASLLRSPAVTRCPKIAGDPSPNITKLLMRVQLIETLTEDIADSFQVLPPCLRPIEFALLDPVHSLPGEGVKIKAKGYMCASVNSKNRVFSTSYSNHLVDVFDDKGKLVESFGDRGSGNNHFLFPCGIAIDHHDRIFVCDTLNHRVQAFSPSWNLIKSLGSKGSFNTPWGITVDQKNNILVCDRHSHRVRIYDQNFVHVRDIGSRGSGEGQFEETISVAVDYHNNIFVSDRTSRIQVFDENGKFLSTFGGGKLAELGPGFTHLTFDSEGNLIVSDHGGHKLHMFDDQGHWIASFGSEGQGPKEFKHPQAVTFDRLNRLVVCDDGNQRVQVFA